MTPSPSSATWLDEEVPLGPAFRRLVGRLLRRGRASWILWAPLALVISTLVSVRASRHVSYEATVVLRASEGRVRAPGADLSMATLRGYVHDWAFTSDRLLALMARYPRNFPDAATEPADAVEEMRKATDVTVTAVEVIEERMPDDPPLSARIEVTYHAGTPEVAVTVARELAQLVVNASLRREHEALAREEAGAAALLGKAEGSFGAAARQLSADSEDPADSTAQLARAQRRAEAARDGLRAAVAAATSAQLATKANEESESLRFDLVDPGRLPPRRSRAVLVRDLLGVLLVTLLVGCLVAGAFDPRILDRRDLSAVGLTVLGEVPALPLPAGPRR
jgi:hypothetical protein